ncbi:immunoglobulin superfamily member 5 isoform 1 precursor [Mus musculus]|uniref:Immunoglobulin superfamily member 5 n=1 Tax=Mus musculus TaxID=10090 RepID=D3YXH1_MOUSE|nr:immunoglobulin superfamily member 5 isoform 1 precursor [Mus musculus]|eukprot:NP_001171357.1 immunoglobulin superfamily member 5 isoform 1 precursor [Mus musculus]
MEGSWRDVLAVLVILAQLTASGSSYQIIEGPQNVTVLKDSEAHFNCTVTHGWKLLMWTLNQMVVLSLTTQGPIITNNRFTYASYNSTDSFISELIIHDVQPSDSGSVQCSLQNSHGFGSAFLSVQVMGTLNIPSNNLIVTEGEPCNVTCYAVGWTSLPDISWELEVPVSHSSYNSFLEPGNFMRVLSVLDLTPLGNGTLTCVAELKDLQASKSLTVNLTVVQPPPDSIGEEGPALPTWAIILLAVAFSLLLILIIVLIIIFCCCCASRREKEESTYQNEIRKSANMRTNKADPETKLKSGKENYGYSSDEAKAAQTASLPPKSAEVSLPEKRSSSLPYQRSTHGMVDAERSKVHNNLKNQEGVDDMAAACGA